MLEFKGVVIKAGSKELFRVPDLHLEAGAIALVGRNGAGKSTFLRSIMQFEQGYQGQILIEGTELKNLSQQERARKVAVVFSKSDVYGDHTGRDVLLLGRLPYMGFLAKASDGDREKIEEVIDEMELAHLVDLPFSQMSDGEKQLIMIGRALAQDTDLILLDEPSAFLDLVNRFRLMQLIQKIAQKKNKLILFSTHNTEHLPEICDAVLLIAEGNLRKITDRKQFIPEILNAFGIEKKRNNEV